MGKRKTLEEAYSFMDSDLTNELHKQLFKSKILDDFTTYLAEQLPRHYVEFRDHGYHSEMCSTITKIREDFKLIK